MFTLRRLVSGDDSTPLWMVTFADVVSLLLTFFIMLFSMVEIERKKFDTIVQAADGFMSGRGATYNLTTAPELTVTSVARRPAQDLGYLAALLRDQIVRSPAFAGSFVQYDAERLVLSLPSDLLFQSEGIVLSRAAEEQLAALSAMFGNVANRVDIFGHSDPRPAGVEAGVRLSLARAAAVADAIRRAGYDASIGIFGYGDGRYGEIPAWFAPTRRAGLARRVDIVVRPQAREEGGWP